MRRIVPAALLAGGRGFFHCSRPPALRGGVTQPSTARRQTDGAPMERQAGARLPQLRLRILDRRRTHRRENRPHRRPRRWFCRHQLQPRYLPRYGARRYRHVELQRRRETDPEQDPGVDWSLASVGYCQVEGFKPIRPQDRVDGASSSSTILGRDFQLASPSSDLLGGMRLLAIFIAQPH